MAALGTVQVNFPAARRTQKSLQWCKAQSREAARSSCVTISTREGCSNPKGRLVSPGEKEWQILWAGLGREVQQESYTSSGSQVKTIKVQAVK